jgi:hypothetical protein
MRRLALLCAAMGFFAMPAAAMALTDFTWSGGAPIGTSSWSNTGNWAGAAAPSGSVGTLTFPPLTNAACTSSPPTATCFTSNNDVAALTVNALSIDNGGPIPSSYQITGNAITLGPGGLTVGTTASSFGVAALRLPITLNAPQTWSIDGNGNGSQIGLYGSVTAPSADTLGITLSHQTFLGLNGNDVEVGPVSITGADPAGSGNGAFRNGVLTVGNPSARAQLNATNGNPISVAHAGIGSESATIGPLTATGANIQVGEGVTTSGETLTVNGALTLDGATSLDMFFNHSGTTAGADYSQINAAGKVDLGNARLLASGGGGPGCPALNQGDVLTLISSTAGVSGTFAGIPDGTTVPVGCSSTTQPAIRINYTPNSVTATVVQSITTAPPPPVIGQTATVAPEKGRVLIKLPKGSHPKAYGLSAAAASGFVPLTAGATVPLGATLDTTHGQVRLSTAVNHSGATQTGHFSKGVFTLQQSRKNPLTTVSMTGGGLSSCHTKLPPGGAPKQAVAARSHKRSLFSNVHGHFRSRGHNSTATVRGTKWTMTDTCAGTLTVVSRGSVVVRDFGLRKNIVVKAGHHYLARALRLTKH